MPYVIIGIAAAIVMPHVHQLDAFQFIHPMLSAISLHPILDGFIFAAGVRLIVFARGLDNKSFKPGKEYGSARWGGSGDIKAYQDTIPVNNIPLTTTESLTMNSRPTPLKYARNKNMLIVGGSGSGKSYFVLGPSLMVQCMSSDYPISFVLTDPKGELLRDYGVMLQKHGYRVKVLNTVNLSESMKYNPFQYMRTESDLLRLADIFMENLGGKGKASDPFWETCEQMLFQALSGLIWTEARHDEQNLVLLSDIISMMGADEENSNAKNAVDLTFEQLEAKKPDHFAVRQYKKFKLAPGKTKNSVLIQLASRLSVFDITEVRDLFSYDELDLKSLGTSKTALFIVVSDTNKSYDFIPGILYSQLFNVLCDSADMEHGGRLPVHVRFLLDEFANIGKIPNFEKLSGTIRSREISATVVLQSKAQLKERYKESADTIIGNMDTELFLGGKEKYTLKELSEILGKETIDIQTDSRTKSQQDSRGENYNRLGRDLMTIDELSALDNTECILQIRGVPPFKSKKLNPKKYENYKYHGNNPKNRYNAKRHMSTYHKPRENAKYEVMAFEFSED